MMDLEEPGKYPIRVLDRNTAEKHASELAKLAGQIPLVEYTEKEILAEEKGDRKFYGKWGHSLVMFDADKPIALVIGYERKSEGNSQYPRNTLYISELAVSENYQHRGLGRYLLKNFFEHNNKTGLMYLEGKLNYSVQTNSADWNKYVQDLYKSFGFTPRATKGYENRTDVILGWEPCL